MQILPSSLKKPYLYYYKSIAILLPPHHIACTTSNPRENQKKKSNGWLKKTQKRRLVKKTTGWILSQSCSSFSYGPVTMHGHGTSDYKYCTTFLSSPLHNPPPLCHGLSCSGFPCPLVAYHLMAMGLHHCAPYMEALHCSQEAQGARNPWTTLQVLERLQ